MPTPLSARLPLLILLVTAAAVAPGCASTGGGSGGGDRNLITAEDMADMQHVSALDAVRRLKPNWLRRRGVDSFRGSFPMAVVVNGVVAGGVRILESYRCGDVKEIRYLNARAATMRYGDKAGGGAILITTYGNKG